SAVQNRGPQQYDGGATSSPPPFTGEGQGGGTQQDSCVQAHPLPHPPPQARGGADRACPWGWLPYPNPFGASHPPSSAANVSFSSALTGSEARRIALACRKSSARKAPTLGRTTRSGAPRLIFSAVMALPMTSTVASRHSQGLGMSRRSSVGAPEISTATTTSARPRSSSNGSGVVAPPSISTRSATTTGRITVGSAIEAASAGLSGPDENAACWRR